MKRILPALVLAAFATLAAAQKPATIPDAQFGLKKGAAAEALQPKPYEFKDGYDTAKPLPGSGMPPMIPHTIDESLPITIANNDCMSCHKAPEKGKKAKRPPIPESHWKAADAGLALEGRRYVCTACHAPQADVAPLVRNDSR
jgi:cytochrome c-type protein NapB